MVERAKGNVQSTKNGMEVQEDNSILPTIYRGYKGNTQKIFPQTLDKSNAEWENSGRTN